jgi:hypothetical protein
MQFLLLLWGDEAAEAAMTPDQRRAMVDEHIAFSKRLRETGQILRGDPLTPSTEGAVVRDGVASDGPFVETKEQLGGYYVIDVGSRDEAIDVAGGVPRSPGMAVEVRAIPEY